MRRSITGGLILAGITLLALAVPSIVRANQGGCHQCVSFECKNDPSAYKTCTVGPGYCIAGGGSC